MHIKVHKCSTALFRAETKETLKVSESASHSARLHSIHADIFHVYSSFTKLISEHSVFASNFEIIQSNLDYKLLMLHVCSIFVWRLCLKCSGCL